MVPSPGWALLGLIACACAGERDPLPADHDAPPETSGGASLSAPTPVVDLAGFEEALAALEGRGVLLNFWAIWCAPCVAELPALAAIHAEFAERGGLVAGLSYDLMLPGEKAETVARSVADFLDARAIPYPNWVFDADDYDAINARFELPGPVPVTLALDRQGRIVDRQVGATDEARLRAMMDKALAP